MPLYCFISSINIFYDILMVLINVWHAGLVSHSCRTAVSLQKVKQMPFHQLWDAEISRDGKRAWRVCSCFYNVTFLACLPRFCCVNHSDLISRATVWGNKFSLERKAEPVYTCSHFSVNFCRENLVFLLNLHFVLSNWITNCSSKTRRTEKIMLQLMPLFFF